MMDVEIKDEKQGHYNKAHKEIDRLVEEKNQQIKKENEEGNEATVTIDNPADSVRESRGKGILQVALPAGKTEMQLCVLNRCS